VYEILLSLMLPVKLLVGWLTGRHPDCKKSCFSNKNSCFNSSKGLFLEDLPNVEKLTDKIIKSGSGSGNCMVLCCNYFYYSIYCYNS